MVDHPLSIAWALDTRRAPDAFDQYRDGFADLARISDFDAEGAAGFVNDTRLTLFGAGAVGRGLSPGQTQSRDAEAIRRSGLDAIIINCNAGPMHADFGDGPRHVPGGGVNVIDLSRPFSLRFDAVDVVSIMVPRDVLPSWFLRRSRHGLAFEGATGVERMIRHHLRALAEEASSLTEAEGSAAIQSLFVLLRQAMGEPVNPAEEDAAALSRTVRQRVALAIGPSLCDPGLSIDAVARGAGVSRSALYRAFEGEGGVAKYIQRRRLEAAYRALTRRSAGRTIGEIAEQHGFTSPAHFSRLFRARFGCSPGDVPATAARGDGSPVPWVAGYDSLSSWLRRA